MEKGVYTYTKLKLNWHLENTQDFYISSKVQIFLNMISINISAYNTNFVMRLVFLACHKLS